MKKIMEQQLLQRFLLAPKLLTSLEVLIKPLPEVAEWLEAQIEQNPLFTLDEPSRRSHGGRIAEASLVVEQRDLYTAIETQVREVFRNQEQLDEAKRLIQSMDERGFLPENTQDSVVLSAMQDFDPPGIAARSIRECLRLQLLRKKAPSLCLDLLERHYDDLVRHRLKKICCCLKIDEPSLRTMIKKEFSRLSFAPAEQFRKERVVPWIPDLILSEDDGQWNIEINTSILPSITLDLRYKLTINEEVKNYLKCKGEEAKHILVSLQKRKDTLKTLGNFLLKTQKEFLEGRKNHPEKMTLHETAKHLGLHHSTVYRAVRNKVISTPRGIFPLGLFFRHATSIPSTMRDKIERLIINENKNQPLSDASIAKELQTSGFPCTTRTVTKYRNALSLPTSRLRKNKPRSA